MAMLGRPPHRRGRPTNISRATWRTGTSTASGSGSCGIRSSGEVLGRAGLRHLAVHGVDEIELRTPCFPDFWGRGLATDAARACLTIGRDWLSFPSVVALALPGNLASQRVLRKAALMLEREVVHAGAAAPAVPERLTVRARRRTPPSRSTRPARAGRAPPRCPCCAPRPAARTRARPAPGTGAESFCDLVLEDRLDLEPQLLLRERHQPRRLGHRPLLPGAAVEPHLGPASAGRDVLGRARASIASLHMRCVPCGSDRSPATKTRSGASSSSSARTIATSAGPIGSFFTVPVW